MDWKIREDIHKREEAIRWDGSGWTDDTYSSLLVKSISETNPDAQNRYRDRTRL